MRSEDVIQAIRLLLPHLSAGDRLQLLREYSLAAPLPRSGKLLTATKDFIETTCGKVTVAEINTAALGKVPDATKKQVANALGYLVRRDLITRHSRGLYERKDQP